MKVSVYLDTPTLDIINCYGTLNDVVNKMLKYCEEGQITFENKPNCTPKERSLRCSIDIESDYYISLLDCYPINSPIISIRRFIYWFIENNMFEQLGWEPIRKYESSKNKKELKKINEIISLLTKIKLTLQDERLTEIKNLLNDIKYTLEE